MNWRDIDINTVGIHDLLTLRAKEKPDQDFIIFEGNGLFAGVHETYTYGEMEKLTNQFANALIKQGIKKGDRVAVYLPNSPEFVIAMYGIFKAGATMVPVSSIYTRREVSFELIDTEAKAIISTVLFRDNIDKDCYPNLKHIIMIEKEGLAYPETSFYDIIESVDSTRPDITWDLKKDIVMIPYTSGTTGQPKGAPHTHYHYTWSLRMASEHMDFADNGCVAVVTPLFHITGYHDTLGMGLFAGYSVVVCERFDPMQLVQFVDKYKISFTLIPTAGLLYLLNIPNLDQYDFTAFRAVMSGGTKVPQAVGEAFSSTFGVDLCEGYGSTEVLITNVSPISKRGPIKYGSTGPNLNFNFEDIVIKVVDLEDGTTELSHGETGEILIKTPCNSLCYFNNPQETEAGFDDGFWRSGDVGYVDEDGYLFLTDRVKEMINVSGFKCWPKEVEEVLLTHPAIQDVTVIGKPDDFKGEVPVAFVQTKSKVQTNAAELGDFVKDKLAKYKWPVDYKFLDVLPKNLQQKPDKAELKKML